MNNLTLEQAAQQLNLTRRDLTQLLRRQGVLDARNIPQGRYAGQGFFVVPQRQYRHPRHGITYYRKTLVTEKGLSLLARVIKSTPTIH